MPAKSQEIILTRTIFASPAQVYAAFTRAEGWCMWCCEKAETEARIGGKLHIYTDGYNAYGKFTCLEENKAVAFTWDGDKEPPTQIHVKLDPQADHTLLTFKVTAEDPEGWIGPEGSRTSFAEFLEHIWGHALDNLKSVLEEKAGVSPVSGNARQERNQILPREQIAQLCEREVLETAARLFGTSKDALGRFDDYEGCANLVYKYELDGEKRILRVSFRSDRNVELIQAELHFVNYLAKNGVRVSKPIPSQNGNLVEVIQAKGTPFIITSFHKGHGMRVPDNGYRYRDGVPIEEYFQNWGQVLGQMHRLTKTYKPLSESIHRSEWHTWEYYKGFPYGERLPVIQKKYEQLLAELHALPKDVNSYGLIHNDFNDGNFTVDYDNGDITVFDFDDSCYFWFMYDIACAWEGGIGRVMFRPLAERKSFMDCYMEYVMTGYSRENTLGDEWLARLPLFLRLIQMQELMHFAQYLNEPDDELQAELRYKIHCIENDIPYLGFFDDIFSPEKPFAM